jgi:hypothetical protein
MRRETSFKKPLLNVFDVGVVFAIVWIVSQTAAFDLAFSGFWTAAPLAILAGLLAVAALIRSGIAAATAFGLLATLIAVLNLPTIPKMFPLRHTVHAATFTDATVADVLGHVAKSKREPPYWRFHVSDQMLAERRVRMTIPENASLADALHALMAETGASYVWNWHKFCGNEPSPLCASFYIADDASGDRDEYYLLIDRNGTAK